MMKKIGITGLALAGALAFSAPASAGDLFKREAVSLKDAPVPVVFSWTGFYFGASAGFAVGHTEGQLDFGDHKREEWKNFLSSLFQSEYDVNGPVYGVHVGYNWQKGRFLLGAEAGINGADIEGDSPCVVIFHCQRSLDWFGEVVARLGVASGNALFYVRGGFAWGDVDTEIGIFSPGLKIADGSETHTGWIAGVGIEYAIEPHFIVRVQYDHVDLGEEKHDLSFFGGRFHLKSDVDLEFDMIRIGASYKFGPRHAPVESLK